MDTVILPVMTYGVETLTLTKLQERKMAVAQRRMEIIAEHYEKRQDPK